MTGIAAPAKINLALHVTGRRADGYHLLESLVVFTRFGDLIEVAPAESDSFAVDGPFADGVPLDRGNLVLKARDALRAFEEGQRSTLPPSVLSDISPTWGEISRPQGFRLSSTLQTSVEKVTRVISPLVGEMSDRTEGGAKERQLLPGSLQQAAIRLTKNLPIASGVGGGSSDAAATLKALTHLWDLGLDPEALSHIAASLGADCPMCLAARPLIARGVGNIIEPVALPPLAMVLVNPGVPVGTPEVFRALDFRPYDRTHAGLSPLPAIADLHDLLPWLAAARNDLQAPAIGIAPPIRSALDALRRNGAAFARMSGSGATCFGLYETGNIAKRAARNIRTAEPGWFVAATRTMA